MGIIDRNYVGLTAAVTAGVAPTATQYDYRSGGFESGSIVHGTAHLETVFDHAPDADYYVFRIGSATDLGAAVDDAITEGIHVLSATQSFYNEGWADDTGAAALAAKEAADNGILYVSSSGNRANSHWQGSFEAYLTGNWLDWDPQVGEDFSNSLGSIGNGSSVNMYLQWDTDAGAADYNLYLYDAADNLLATSVSGGNTFEEINWTNNTGSALSVYAAVILNTGNAVDLELFERSGSTFEHATPAGSLTSPNNNTAANCLVIGAVPFRTYDDGNIASYSSQGPTNSGARGIDLVGPTNTFTLAYNGDFGGTSCATPNVAGTAVALWSSVPLYNADGVRILLLHLAQNHHDWGGAGPDPVYGYGGVHLPVHALDTEWVDPWSPNSSGFTYLPWNSFADALAAGGPRIILMGGNYVGTYTLTNPVVIDGGGSEAILGGSTP